MGGVKASVLTLTTGQRAATRRGFDFGVLGLSQGRYTRGARFSIEYLAIAWVKKGVGVILERCNRWRTWVIRMSVVCEREIADSRASAIVAPPTEIQSRAMSLPKQRYGEFCQSSDAINRIRPTLVIMHCYWCYYLFAKVNDSFLISEPCPRIIQASGNEAGIRLELGTHAAVSCIWRRIADDMAIAGFV